MSKDTNEIKTYLKELENRIEALEAQPPKSKKGQDGGDYIKTGKSKELRGDILNGLYEILGEEVSVKVLKIIMGRKADENSGEIEKGIEYLVKKGYAQKAKCGACVTISAAGINLCEGDLSDAGVIL